MELMAQNKQPLPYPQFQFWSVPSHLLKVKLRSPEDTAFVIISSLKADFCSNPRSSDSRGEVIMLFPLCSNFQTYLLPLNVSFELNATRPHLSPMFVIIVLYAILIAPFLFHMLGILFIDSLFPSLFLFLSH